MTVIPYLFPTSRPLRHILQPPLKRPRLQQLVPQSFNLRFEAVYQPQHIAAIVAASTAQDAVARRRQKRCPCAFELISTLVLRPTVYAYFELIVIGIGRKGEPTCCCLTRRSARTSSAGRMGELEELEPERRVLEEDILDL